jgi:hypothetical protein
MFPVWRLESDCPNGEHGAHAPSGLQSAKACPENERFYKQSDPGFSDL